MHENLREIAGGRLAGTPSRSAGPGEASVSFTTLLAGPGERLAGHFS
jgi:hypothetical protein